MSILTNDKLVAIDASLLEARLQEVINEFQDKVIVFEGESVLLTTALQRINERAIGKANIVVANELPSPTVPNTQYWLKTYNGETKDTGRFIVITDQTNTATFVGVSDVDLSEYVKDDQIVISLNGDYYYGWYNQGLNELYYTKHDIKGTTADVYVITLVNNKVTAITKQATQGTINADGDLEYNSNTYIHQTDVDGFYMVKGEEKVISVNAVNDITGVAGRVNDVKLDGTSMLKNKTVNIETPTTAEIEELFKGIPNSGLTLVDFFYPIGTIITNNGTNPSDIYSGTTWERYITGTQVLYGADAAGTTISEELPNITGTAGGVVTYSTVGTGSGVFYNSPSEGARSVNQNTSGGMGFTTLKFSARNSSNVYKDNGKVRPAGKTVCYWIRTA